MPLVRGVLVALVVCLLVAAPANAATATLTTPASSSAASTTMPVDISVSDAPLNLRLQFEYTSGPNASTGATWTLALLSVALHTTFTLSTTDPVGGSGGAVVVVTPSAGATGSSLPEGVYSVRAIYLGGFPVPGTVTSSDSTNVVIDRTTLTPTLLRTNSGTAGRLSFDYTLPETAQASSGTLTLSGPGMPQVVALPNSLAGTHSLSAEVAAGTYTATLAYRDALGNPVANAILANLVVAAAASSPPTQQTPQTTTTTTVSPVTTLAKLRLAIWTTAPSANGRVLLRVSFKPFAGARSYKLVAIRNGKKRIGRCKASGKGSKRRIVCTVSAPRNQTWRLRASARGGTGAELAERIKSVRTAARRR